MIVTSRILFLALIALTTVAGLMTRSAAGRDQHIPITLSLEQRPPATGATFGRFRLEGFETSVGGSMRLSSPACEKMVLVRLLPIGMSPPEAVYASVYPRDKWNTSFIYMHSISGSFSHGRRYAEYLIYGFWSRLFGAARDAADGAYVVFHAPSECELSPSDMVDAADALIAFAKRS